jgi:hypothetical protein
VNQKKGVFLNIENAFFLLFFLGDGKKAKSFSLAPIAVEIPRFWAWIVTESGTIFPKMPNLSAPN